MLSSLRPGAPSGLCHHRALGPPLPPIARRAGAGQHRAVRAGPGSVQPPAADITSLKQQISAVETWAKERRLCTGNKSPVVVSDLVSADPEDSTTTLQWVNLVMAGGGMLGIGHVGFVRVLEQAGVRFIGLGGASAGAINALLIAAVRERPDRMSWQSTEKILSEGPFASFEDGDEFFTKLRQSIEKEGLKLKQRLFSLFWNRDTVSDAYQQMGLHKGEAFHTWLQSAVQHTAATTDSLLKHMMLGGNNITFFQRESDGQYRQLDNSDVELWTTGDADVDRHHYPLRLVASEVVTQSMIVFPRDADLFYPVEELAPPADFVRASMSVPVFFQPLTIPYRNSSGSERGAVHYGGQLSRQGDKWDKRHGVLGKIPTRAVFCDGGTLSNFPMHLFVGDRRAGNNAPLYPTLGVRLGQDRGSMQVVNDTGVYLGSMFDTTRNLLDRQFLFNNPMHAHEWVGTVNTTGYNWLDFNMSEENKLKLMLEGMLAARTFLTSKVVHMSDGAPKPPKLRKKLEFEAPSGEKVPPSDESPPAPATAAVAVTEAAAATAAVPSATTAGTGTGADSTESVLGAWERYKAIAQLLDLAVQAGAGDISDAARTALLQNLRLEERYNQDVVPAMELIKAARAELGDEWAYGIFLPSFDSNRQAELLQARRVTQSFWRGVQAAYQPKPGQLQVITPDWWTNNWIGRGRQYRLLVEPLDIANFYFNNYHIRSGHYIDYKDGSGAIRAIGPDVGDETTIDNHNRPGRYIMLQQLEAGAVDQTKFGPEQMTSSLTTARELKARVGGMWWQQYVESL